MFNYDKVYKVGESDRQKLELLDQRKKYENRKRVEEFYSYQNLRTMVTDSLKYKLEQINIRGTTQEPDGSEDQLLDPPSDCDQTICLKDISVDAY